jgi:ATP-dependent Lon protease
MRASLQRSVSEMFAERAEDFNQLIDKAITEYDWSGEIKKQIDAELQRHARSFVENSMRNISRDFDKYKEIQREADALVRARLTELWLETNKPSPKE